MDKKTNIITFFKEIFSHNTQKKHLSCDWAEHGINFQYDEIKTCCMCFHEGGFQPPIPYLNTTNFDIKKYFKSKKNIRKLHRSGKIHKYCKGCMNLKEGFWDKDDYISHINFDNSTYCSSNCCYCFTHEKKEEYNSKPPIPILPIVKELMAKKQLLPKGEVMFGGGEPTENPEFEELLTLLMNKGFPYFKIHSSGIKYSKAIERCLNEDKADLIISVDAGTEETYKKIKNITAFEKVWENLQKYSQKQNQNKTQVKAKYLIVPGYNDNQKDIDDFFSQVARCQIKAVRVDIEYIWYTKNRNNIEALIPMFKLLKHAEKKAKTLDLLHFCFHTEAYTAIQEHKELFEKDFT